MNEIERAEIMLNGAKALFESLIERIQAMEQQMESCMICGVWLLDNRRNKE